jgi:hypothetical protein
VFLNRSGGEFEFDDFRGIVHRLSKLKSGRINFYEFLHEFLKPEVEENPP